MVRHLEPIFATLSPPLDAAPRTPGREQVGGTAEHGYLHCGPHGAGHFVKMVHNGIEYGIMAAYAEGLNILRHANVGKRERDPDAETTPLEHPEYYQYDLNLADITELWRRGSVIGSWLLDLTARALLSDPELSKFGGRVSDSGEGRWTIQAAVDDGGSRSCAHGLALRALRLAERGRVCEPGPVRHALRVRRPRGEAEGLSRPSAEGIP